MKNLNFFFIFIELNRIRGKLSSHLYALNRFLFTLFPIIIVIECRAYTLNACMPYYMYAIRIVYKLDIWNVDSFCNTCQTSDYDTGHYFINCFVFRLFSDINKNHIYTHTNTHTHPKHF